MVFHWQGQQHLNKRNALIAVTVLVENVFIDVRCGINIWEDVVEIKVGNYFLIILFSIIRAPRCIILLTSSLNVGLVVLPIKVKPIYLNNQINVPNTDRTIIVAILKVPANPSIFTPGRD